MTFNFKPQGQSNNHSPKENIDFNAINGQVVGENTPAIISLIVDLGVHTPKENATDTKTTAFETQEEAEAYLARIVEIKGEKDGAKFKVTQQGNSFVVNGEIYQPKDGQEIAIFADLSTVVDYGDEIGKKPYRLMLNKSFMGDIRGLSLKAVPPQVGSKVWTFAGNSMLTKLAKATKKESIIDGTVPDDLNNIGLILGEPVMVDVKRTDKNDNVYINVGGVSSLPSAMLAMIDKSLYNPVGITFENATVELLKQAHLRGDVIKKIKSANNYKGSNMEKAINELERVATATKKVVVDETGGNAPDVNDDLPF